MITITLNARLQPEHRADLEDALESVLQASQIGTVCGGGSLLGEGGEVTECDIEIETEDTSDEAIGHIVDFLETAIAPKGSRIRLGERVIPFGCHEGLALYLNGTDLPDEVYQGNDINEVWSSIEDRLGEAGSIHSYHQGNTETALYLYGQSFTTMHELIKPLLEAHPLCQKCRVVQIA